MTTFTEFESFMKQGGSAALSLASEFFMKNDPVFHTLRAVTGRLRDLGIPYAVAGGMALVAHGYDRTTSDVDILVTADGLKQIHEALDGLGYIPPFAGSKQLRDGTNKVRIEFLITGGYPGDGKPKPVAFPDPADVGVEVDGIKYLRLDKLIELKLASGMTNPGRMKDLGDVQELIRSLKLPKAFGENLNPFVRGKFSELWDGVSGDHTSDNAE